MLNALIWNLLLTAVLAILLAAMCRLPALHRRPALRCWLWLLLLIALVTPPLVDVPLLPALAQVPQEAVSPEAVPQAEEMVQPALPEHSSFEQPMAMAGVPGGVEGDIPTEMQADFAVSPASDKSVPTSAGGTVASPLPSDSPFPYLLFLVSASLLGTVLLITVYLSRVMKLHRWLERAGTEDTRLAALCAEVASALGIRTKIRSCVIETQITPLLWAWKGPRIVMPERLIHALEREPLQNIVAHELAHFLRGDHWINLLVFAIKMFFWWNPIVWWAERELHAAQELCCDAIAIDCCKASRRGYATTLMQALEFIQAEPPIPQALTQGMGSKRSIIRRFEMIGETRLSYRLSWRNLLVLLLLAVPLLCMPVRGEEKTTETKSKTTITANLVIDVTTTKESNDASDKEKADEKDLAEKVATEAKKAKSQKEGVMGERPHGDCSISGKVVSAETGKPIVDAHVGVVCYKPKGGVVVPTASDGTFHIKDLPEGPLALLVVSESGDYQRLDCNPEGKSGQYPEFKFKKGEQRSGVVLKLKPATKDASAEKTEVGKKKPPKPQKENVHGERPNGDCSISGKVVAAKTGKPIADAHVYLHYYDTSSSLSVRAASDGTFQVKDISEGPFLLQISSPGYQNFNYNPGDKPGQYSRVTLKKGEQRSGLVLKLEPAFSIKGKVLDEKGEVPENVEKYRVSAWIQGESDVPKYRTSATIIPNPEDGSYQLNGLNGTPTYVTIARQSTLRPEEENGAPPLYYPGTFFRKEAKRVTFDDESCVENVDITLQKEGGLTLEGTVRDEAGKPIPEVLVVVSRPDMLFDFAHAYTDKEGKYRIRHLGEGEFLAQFDALHRGFVKTRIPVEVKKLEDGKPVELDATLRQGATITGKLVDEEGKPWEIGNSQGIVTVRIDRGDPSAVKHGYTGLRNKYRQKDTNNIICGFYTLGEGDYPNGGMIFPTKSTFLVEGLKPGSTRIHFITRRENQRVLKILYQGEEVDGYGIETKPGDEIKDVTIVIGSTEPKGSKDSKDASDAKKVATKKKGFEPQKERVMPNRPKGDCSISGQVLSAETGEPVPGARVYLFYMKTFSPMFINAASDGTFCFKEIPEGPFSLRTSHVPGYQDFPYDPDHLSGQFPQFTLKKGEQREGIELKVQPAYSISGEVLDEKGKIPECITSVTVMAWTWNKETQKYEGKQAIVNRHNGSYRLDGLDGSPTYVMALNWNCREAESEEVYSPIYHPSTFSRKDAKLITFDKTRQAKDIDITLRMEGGLTLEGTVLDAEGKPVPEVFVVAHRPDMLFDLVTDYTDKDGKYRIHSLGEGEFMVHFDAKHRGFVRTRTTIEMKKEGEKKPTKLNVTLEKGVTISGKLIDQDGKAWNVGPSHGHAYTVDPEEASSEKIRRSQSFSLTGFINKYQTKDYRSRASGDFSLGEGAYTNEDMVFLTPNTFVVPNLKPGHNKIGFTPKKENQKLLKILYQGKDITESGIETKPGEKIEDVTIVIGPSKKEKALKTKPATVTIDSMPTGKLTVGTGSAGHVVVNGGSLSVSSSKETKKSSDKESAEKKNADEVP